MISVVLVFTMQVELEVRSASDQETKIASSKLVTTTTCLAWDCIHVRNKQVKKQDAIVNDVNTFDSQA